MDVRVDPAAMQDLVTKAIFDGLTAERRDELVKGAIKSLLATPQGTNAYGREAKSPLQMAFDSASRAVAERIATEKLETDSEFKAQMEGLFKDVAARLFADDIREKVVSKICDAVVTGLGDRYR